jgi:hypothetical protein
MSIIAMPLAVSTFMLLMTMIVITAMVPMIVAGSIRGRPNEIDLPVAGTWNALSAARHNSKPKGYLGSNPPLAMSVAT